MGPDQQQPPRAPADQAPARVGTPPPQAPAPTPPASGPVEAPTGGGNGDTAAKAAAAAPQAEPAADHAESNGALPPKPAAAPAPSIRKEPTASAPEVDIRKPPEPEKSAGASIRKQPEDGAQSIRKPPEEDGSSIRKQPKPAAPAEEPVRAAAPPPTPKSPEPPAGDSPPPPAQAGKPKANGSAPEAAAPAAPPAAPQDDGGDEMPIYEDLMVDEWGAMRVGYVISVSGRKIYGILVSETDLSGEEGVLRLADAAQIGALVKMPTSRSITFGMISSIEIRNPSSSPPAAYDQRVVEIDLFGEALYDQSEDGLIRFQRGISVYPSIGTEIRETTHEELAQIYARPSDSNVLIGALYQDPELPAYLLVDDLLGKHFAVLGTTGTGKSCSTTVILRSVLNAHPNGHVLLLDPHNEYGQAFDDYAEVVRPDNLHLPFWLLNFEELVEVMCSHEAAGRKAEVNILKDAVYAAKLQFVGDQDDVTSWLTVDTPVPFRLNALTQFIEDSQGQLERPEETAPYMRLKARIEALRADRRYDFMFAGLSVRDSMAEVLSRLLRIPVDSRPITILQLSGVPSEIVDVVVSLLCRMVFDFAMWSMGGESVPVLLVCEEAHRYIPKDEATGFTPTRKAIARIAKEGRKYGVSLCLVTQRPSELSETILSQCNTIFSLRMSNERDQQFVRRALPDSATGMLNALPALRNQEAIVVGEGVTVPMRIRFMDLENYNRPQSDTAVFSDAWENDSDRGGDFLHSVVDRWRRQSY